MGKKLEKACQSIKKIKKLSRQRSKEKANNNKVSISRSGGPPRSLRVFLLFLFSFIVGSSFPFSFHTLSQVWFLSGIERSRSWFTNCITAPDTSCQSDQNPSRLLYVNITGNLPKDFLGRYTSWAFIAFSFLFPSKSKKICEKTSLS